MTEKQGMTAPAEEELKADAHPFRGMTAPVEEAFKADAYPFSEGSAPDVLARRVAELLPGFNAEIGFNAVTDQPSFTVFRLGTDDEPSMGIDIDLQPDPDELFGDWRISGSAEDGLRLVVAFERQTLDPEVVERVIRAFQVFGVLPAFIPPKESGK